jgi:hypothetical protein
MVILISLLVLESEIRVRRSPVSNHWFELYKPI